MEIDFSMFQGLAKKREAERKKYDHYRVKLAKLKEKEAKQQDTAVTSGAMLFKKGPNKQHERLVRNIAKFEQAEHYFNSATKVMDDKVQEIMKKLDYLAIYLNVKFF